jgi:hypothetical protein
MTPKRDTALKKISNFFNFSPSIHTPKKIVIIGVKFLATLVKVSETYLTTHNIRAVLKTD